MPIVRYDPFSDLQRLRQDLDRFWPDFSLLTSETAPMNLYEENGKLVAEVSLPNFNKDEIKVTTDEGVLEVSAEHEEKEENRDSRHYYLRESSGHFLRRFSLPEGTKAEKAEAEYKNGVLRITMPSENKKETKKISVQ